MGMARVNLKEVDLSTRVASFGGVYGAIVIPTKKGQAQPYLATSDTQFLNTFTPKGKVNVGYDLSYYSALAYLERANKLWVKRVTNDAMFGGLVIGDAVGTNAKLIDNSDITDPNARLFGANETLFIHGANEGAWANEIGIKITTIDDDADLVEANSFLIEVFTLENQAVPVESFLCSRVLGQKDGRGLNMFVEDVLEGSAYIRAISDSTVDELTLPKTQATVLFMGAGEDGVAITDANMVAALDSFSNPNEYPVTLFLDGGYSTPAYQVAMDLVAKTRQDSVAILSTPYSEEVKSDYMTALVDYRKNQLNLNSSYSALYTPHLQIQDKFNDRKLWISPDGGVAGSISFSSQNYEIWYPPAGYKRGVLNVLDTRVRFSDGEMDTLQNNGINPIRFISGKGIVVWGQRTLLARASALDRLNVRLLLIVIEPAIKELLADFLFELNDVANRVLVETKISSYLTGIQARKGIYGFDVVSDDSNNMPSDIDANRMNVDIFIKPTISTEEIPVRVVITPNNISFSQAQGAI